MNIPGEAVRRYSIVGHANYERSTPPERFTMVARGDIGFAGTAYPTFEAFLAKRAPQARRRHPGDSAGGVDQAAR